MDYKFVKDITNSDSKINISMSSGSTVLFEGWKLHIYYEDQCVELYYLPNDTGERNNIAEKELIKVHELLEKLRT